MFLKNNYVKKKKKSYCIKTNWNFYKSTLFYTTIQKETNNKTKLKTMVTKRQYKKNPARTNKGKETKLKSVVDKILIVQVY